MGTVGKYGCKAPVGFVTAVTLPVASNVIGAARAVVPNAARRAADEIAERSVALRTSTRSNIMAPP